MEARTDGDDGTHICHDTNRRCGDRVMTTLLPPNVKVHLAFGFIDMRKGIDGLSMSVQGVLQQESVHRPPVRVPRPYPGQPDQNHLLGWHRVLPVHQTARTWCLLVAAERQTGRDTIPDLGPVVASDRRHRLACAGTAVASGSGGLMLRPIDSMTQAA